ncbi:MAG: hypothetical protein OXC39_01380, partial [Candidatus Dadabacteria bacterium]|nr:hypothetical protein [Candidatus Dadabacteria bacterium]
MKKDILLTSASPVQEVRGGIRTLFAGGANTSAHPLGIMDFELEYNPPVFFTARQGGFLCTSPPLFIFGGVLTVAGPYVSPLRKVRWHLSTTKALPMSTGMKGIRKTYTDNVKGLPTEA